MSLWKIYRVFAEMGAVCFGGGYAMLSLVQRVVVEEHGWATEEELMDYYAIGQCTPGVIAVNTATFVGTKKINDMNEPLEKEYKALKWEVIKAMISLLGVFFASTLLLGGAEISGLRLLVATILIESVVVSISLKRGLCADGEQEAMLLERLGALINIVYIFAVIVIWIGVVSVDVSIWKILLAGAWITLYPVWSVVSDVYEMLYPEDY